MKESVYEITWTRQKGKRKKNGTTHVISENITDALATFTQTYPEREADYIVKEGDDILIPNRFKVDA